MGKLDGKVALITGAAGGIGRASSKLFVEEGAKGVVMVDIWDEMGEKTAKELGPNAIYIHGDVSQESDIKKSIDLAIKKFGRLDVIFSNAGNPGAGGGIEDIATDDFDHTVAVHLRAAFLYMRYSIPIMKKQGSGVILLMASNNALEGRPLYADYNASKAGVVSLAQTLALEFAPWLRVNAVCPGYVLTPMQEAEYTPEMMEELNAKIPFKRHADPGEVAALFAYLASSEASYITGQAIPIDGGETA